MKDFFTLAKLEEVEGLYENTPEGLVVDADTLLIDAIESADYEFAGFAQDIFNIWRNSTDKEAVEEMFYKFTAIQQRNRFYKSSLF